jgi:hypothetical protein
MEKDRRAPQSEEPGGVFSKSVEKRSQEKRFLARSELRLILAEIQVLTDRLFFRCTLVRESPFVGGVTRERIGGLNDIPAQRKDDMVHWVQMDHSTQIKTNSLSFIVRLSSMIKNLSA